MTTSFPFRSCPPSPEISSAQYKSICSLCGFCVVCWHGAEPGFLRFAGQPTIILLFFHQSRRIFITLGVLDIYVWNLILICLYKHTNISLTRPQGVNAWGNVWIRCSSPPLLPASSFIQKLLGSEGWGFSPSSSPDFLCNFSLLTCGERRPCTCRMSRWEFFWCALVAPWQHLSQRRKCL